MKRRRWTWGTGVAVVALLLGAVLAFWGILASRDDANEDAKARVWLDAEMLAHYVARMKSLGWDEKTIQANVRAVEKGKMSLGQLEEKLEAEVAGMEAGAAMMRLLGVKDEEDRRIFPQIRSIPVLEEGVEFDKGILRLRRAKKEGVYLGELCYSETVPRPRSAGGELWIADNPAAARRLLCSNMVSLVSMTVVPFSLSKTVTWGDTGDVCVRDWPIKRSVSDKHLWFTAGPYVVYLRASSAQDILGLGRVLAGVLNDVVHAAEKDGGVQNGDKDDMGELN